jgi:homoserine trans-succinylase
MNFRQASLGAYTFYTSFTRFYDAVRNIEHEQAIGMISTRAPVESMAMETEARRLLEQPHEGSA